MCVFKLLLYLKQAIEVWDKTFKILKYIHIYYICLT